MGSIKEASWKKARTPLKTKEEKTKSLLRHEGKGQSENEE